MSQSEDRSGRNPEWVATLGDLNPEECRTFLASLLEIELKECEAPNCEIPAIYHVSFHGCTRFSVCGMHRAVWATGLSRAIEHNGSIVCETCEIQADTLDAIMQWHAI